MAMDTLIVFAASYGTLAAAEADYSAVRNFYLESGLIASYDAAVLTRNDIGKVKIVDKREQPTRRGAWHGLGIGLAGGALMALYPAVGLGAGLLLGGAGGAGLDALAGHVTAGLSHTDLRELGELLDEGHSGLVVIAASDLGSHIGQVLNRANKVTRKQLKADEKALEKEIDAAAGQAQAS